MVETVRSGLAGFTGTKSEKLLKIESLYDRFGEAVYRYLTVKLGSASDAEDVLQEVFCRLIRYSFRLSFVRDPRVFVFRIARNEANRFLRSKIKENEKTRQGTVLAESILRFYGGPDKQTEHAVGQALSEIPDDQREVIVLKAFEGMTFKEIAAMSGESINTVASRYRYGIEKMRSLLERKS